MKYKLVRLLAVLALFLFVTSGVICTAMAAETNGSICITLRSDGNSEHTDCPVTGAQISIYQVADAVPDPFGKLSFDFTDDFQLADVDLSDLKADALVNDLTEYIEKHACPALDMQSTSSCGVVEFSNLPPGLYFLQMTKQDEECHFMKAFLVSLPMQDENGNYIYNVNAVPKLQIVRDSIELTVIKRWQNDLEAQRPPSITVELLGDGLLADTAVLSKENNWTCTFQNLSREIRWAVQEKEIPEGYDCVVGCPVTQNGGTTIVITNTQREASSSLIQTGQLRWPIPLLFLSGFWMLACSCFLFLKPHNNIHGSALRAVLLIPGFLLIAAGLGLCAANQCVSRSAGKASADLLLRMQQAIVQNAQISDDISASQLHVNPYDQQAVAQALQMPSEYIDGFECIGLLEIPTLKLQLPVLSDWSYEKLKAAPCRQMGSIRSDDLVIAGHNYRTHFGRLDQLKVGDSIQFVDMEGVIHHYAVDRIQIIAPTDIDAVLDDTLDLVLYTCTYSGKNRLMIGCQRTDEGSSISPY